MLRCLAIGLLIAAGGCATERPSGPAIPTDRLLNGSALFGAEIPAADPIDILRLSQPMQQFVDDVSHKGDTDPVRFRRLLRAFADAGYLDVEYDPNRTLTAAQTFKLGTGNCLSYTNLFIALARGAGFDVRYQSVDVPPIWSEADGWLTLNQHINLVVRDIIAGPPGAMSFRRDFVIDFDTLDYQGRFRQHVIRDRTAFALFYANLGVEALRAGRVRLAFANLKRSLIEDPDVASSWINLGVLFARNGQSALAEAAYFRGLHLEPNDPSALSNLVHLYERTGNAELAAQFRERVRAYQARNPYYHYGLAKAAYAKQDYVTALNEVHRAIALKKDDHRFYFLEGLIGYQTGDIVAARTAIREAQRRAGNPALKQRYTAKLAALGLQKD